MCDFFFFFFFFSIFKCKVTFVMAHREVCEAHKLVTDVGIIIVGNS